MRAFISSEMASTQDTRRRRAAIDALTELGHTPVFFEAQPARPLPKGTDMREYLRGLVRGCQVLLEIVDATVTDAMTDELQTA
jgi:hypothetical protein